jgi:hypothetical protein
MKLPVKTFLHAILLILFYHSVHALPVSGFYLPDSVHEMTLRYKTLKNLIVLPVMINDSVRVNLILDTGCRNLVLFGKRFQKMLQLSPGRIVQFSGLGSGKPVNASVSLFNKVSIKQVLGERIPIVVVPNKNVLVGYNGIDGVIGYDIFLKFEIQLNPARQIITFRPAATAVAPSGFTEIPLKIIDSRPVMESNIIVGSEDARDYELMIDTGSAVGLLLKTTTLETFGQEMVEYNIGHGFNGPISGYRTDARRLQVRGLEMQHLPAGIIKSEWHNYASLGMAVLKDYILVLNYCKAYACLKKIAKA